MALRGKAPDSVEKRLKALFYGPAGCGKTTASIQFPSPYLIDTEKGAENDKYVKLLKAAGGVYFHTTDFDDLLKECTALLTEKHGYKTLIIDPLTVIYNDMLDKSSKSLATTDDPSGTAFGRHKGGPDRKIKHLINLLMRLDMNVIITSHSKTRWEKNGKELVDAGQTYDCYAKLDYIFDLVIELQKRGPDRVGIIRKTRLETFPEGEVIPFSYAEISKRYGKDVLERGAKAEVLATPEQVKELKRLIDLLKIEPATVDKWLDKAQAESIEEMPQYAAEACLKMLESQLNPKGK